MNNKGDACYGNLDRALVRNRNKLGTGEETQSLLNIFASRNMKIQVHKVHPHPMFVFLMAKVSQKEENKAAW